MKDRKKLILCFILFLSFFICPIVTSPNKKINSNKNSTISNDYSQNKIENLRLQYSNQDIIAILKIENTNLESIVTKGEDNDYYLTHNLNKEYDKIGNVFMDYRNFITDQKILIYGHNSQMIDIEFHLLENYLDPTFYQDHKKIIFETENSRNIYDIFSIIIVTKDYQHMKLNFNDQEWIDHLNYLKQNSIYDTKIDIQEDDQILILQTCYYSPKNSYLLIVAKKE